MVRIPFLSNGVDILCDRIAPLKRNEERATWIRIGTEKRSLAYRRFKIDTPLHLFQEKRMSYKTPRDVGGNLIFRQCDCELNCEPEMVMGLFHYTSPFCHRSRHYCNDLTSSSSVDQHEIRNHY